MLWANQKNLNDWKYMGSSRPLDNNVTSFNLVELNWKLAKPTVQDHETLE